MSINRGQKRDVCRDIRSGQYYLVGQSWQLDQCTTCYCGKSGKAACAVQMCERDPKCKDLLHDNSQCCPKCKDENGKQFTDLLNWCYPFSKIMTCISICMNTRQCNYGFTLQVIFEISLNILQAFRQVQFEIILKYQG